MIIRRLKIVFNNPSLLIKLLLYLFSPFFSDRTYLKLMSFVCFGKAFDLYNPVSFNEKMNWLKLNHKQYWYTTLVDKIAVKEYVKNKLGEAYVIPLIKKWENLEEINLNDLPQKCVIKSNCDSSGVIIYKKGITTLEFIRKVLKKKKTLYNYYYYSREYPYKGVKQCYYAENFIESVDGDIIKDFKFWCFNGVPRVVYVTVKNDDIYENFYDMNFSPLNIDHNLRRRHPEFKEPVGFNEMKKIASILSKDIPFVRIDFFHTGKKFYFSEFTFYDWGGLKPFNGEWDIKLGELLVLPNAK